MQTVLGIPYSDKHDLNKLDLFLPDQPNGCCLFCIHGGGWSAGGRPQWHAVANHFAAMGYVAVSTSYRLVPQSIFPAQVEDVRLAMAFVRARAKEYGFGPAKMAAMGSSAGGHLAALLATIGPDDSLGLTDELALRDTRPNAVVPYCPVTTLCAGHHQNGSLTDAYLQFIGKPESEAGEAYRRASPMERVTGAEPPFLFIHGDADDTVPLSQSEEMSRRLKEAGVRSEVAVLPGVGHGFGYGVTTNAQKQAVRLMEAFLRSVFG
jgi:acetyl esterase/lipase